MNIMRSSELMGTLLGTALFCESPILPLILSIVNSVGHLPMVQKDVGLWMPLQIDWTEQHLGWRKDLRNTGQAVGEVEVVFGEVELAEEERSDVTTMMR